MRHERRSWLTNYVTDQEAGSNISWSAVFAGAITFIAVFFLLSFIGSAIGFGLISPKDANPFDGVSTGVLVWTVIQLILSLYSAGFVAGIAARRVGLLHGFLTWALSLVISVLFIFNVIASTLSVVTNTVATVGSAAGSVVGDVAGAAGDAIGSAANAATDQITKALDETDFNQVQSDMEQYLKDTENEKLRPEYLQSQLDKSVEDIKNAAIEAAKNPNNAEAIANDTAKTLADRAKAIAESVDKEDIQKAVAKNSELSEQEVGEITDNIYNGLQDASQKAQTAVNEASVQIEKTVEELKVKANEAVETGKDVADTATKTTSKASIFGFIGLLLGAVVAMLGGLSGSRISRKPEVVRN